MPAQVWWRQRVELAGDTVWDKLEMRDRLRRAELRGEFLFFQSQEDKVAQFGNVFNLKGFGLIFPSPAVLSRSRLPFHSHLTSTQSPRLLIPSDTCPL